MKYPLLLILIHGISIITNAQLTKGLHQIGGSMRLYQDKTENEYVVGNAFSTIDEFITREYSVDPKIGFFVGDNVSVGIGVGYSHVFNRVQASLTSDPDIVIENESRTNLFHGRFFSRFHKSVFEKFYLYVEPAISMSTGTIKNEQALEAEQNVFGYGITASPGMILFISDHFGIEASFGSVGYNRFRQKLKDADSDPKNIETDLGLDFSLRTFQFGLQYYF